MTTRAPRLRFTGRSILLAAAVVAVVLVAAYVVLRSTRVLGWVAAAAVLAALLEPLVDLVATRMRRGLALVLVLLVTFGLVGGVIWAGVGDLQSGLSRLRSAAPDAAERVEEGDSWIGEAARDFGLQDRVEEFVDDLPGRVTGGSGADAVRTAATRGLATLITVVLTIFLIGHGPRLIRGLLRQFSDDRRRTVSTVLYRAYHRTWGYVTAMLGKGVVLGVATYVLAEALDIPASSVLGVVVGVLSMVPYLGVILGGLPVVLLAGGLHGGIAAAGAVAGVVALQTADALVTARLVQPRTMRVGPAVSLAVVLLGLTLYGLGGAAVALPLAVFVVAVTSEGLRAAEAAAPDVPAEEHRVLP